MGSPNRHPFPTTHWSLVALSGQDADAEARQAALDALMRRYLLPLRAHLIYHHRIRRQNADDLLQEFIAQKVLDQSLFQRADRRRGRFRNFVLTALDRFVVSRARHSTAQKRMPGNEMLNLDEAIPAVASGSAERIFEIVWAQELVRRAVEEVRRVCLSNNRRDIWDVFDGRLLGPMLEGLEPVEYDLLARRNGLPDTNTARNILATAKRTFARSLRAVVAEYELDERAIEEEIADLRSILANGGPCAR